MIYFVSMKLSKAANSHISEKGLEKLKLSRSLDKSNTNVLE